MLYGDGQPVEWPVGVEPGGVAAAAAVSRAQQQRQHQQRPAAAAYWRGPAACSVAAYSLRHTAQGVMYARKPIVIAQVYGAFER